MTRKNEEVIPIVCMNFSIAVFRFYRIFPKNSKGSSYFFLTAILVSILGSGTLVSSILHLYHTIHSKEYNHIELDCFYIISFTTGYLLIWSFIIRIKSAVEMYTMLSDFRKFGKPTKFDENNKKFNKYSVMHFMYVQCIFVIGCYGSDFNKVDSCRETNLALNLTEVCGLFTYTWVPFDIDYSPARESYFLLQLFGCQIYVLAGLTVWIVFETIQQIVIRIRHVKNTFIEALAARDSVERRRRFDFAVRYHNELLRLEEKLNDTFSLSMFTHVSLTAAVMGGGFYAFLNSYFLSTFVLTSGWFWGLFMDCISGQLLQDESLKLSFAIYESPWYNYEEPLKKDIMFVIKKCQTSMELRAGPFGFMDRATFLGVLKVAYSYITLLQNTS